MGEKSAMESPHETRLSQLLKPSYLVLQTAIKLSLIDVLPSKSNNGALDRSLSQY